MMASGSVSTTSSASRGGMPFDVLCRGTQRGYSFNVAHLRNLTFEERTTSLIDQVESTIRDLELQSDREIGQFCIGKTYAPALAHQTFNPEDPNTWGKRGLSERWRQTYKKWGYDGLVALGAVNRSMLNDTSYGPSGHGCNTAVWDQQSYALALEGSLITHYAFTTADPRLANISFHRGQLQGRISAGYVVYMAYQYK